MYKVYSILGIILWGTHAFGLTQESALNRCEGAVALIKNSDIAVQDPSIQNTINAVVARMSEAAAQLKKTHDVQTIYRQRNVCDQGFKVIQFLVEHFAVTPTDALKPIADVPPEGHTIKDEPEAPHVSDNENPTTDDDEIALKGEGASHQLENNPPATPPLDSPQSAEPQPASSPSK